MSKSKSQAALEFLTTYGWVFIVLLLTVSALYYFGLLDFGKYLPQECTFPSQFNCVDFTMGSSGPNVKFALVNGIGEKINVTGLTITNDAASPLVCDSPASFIWLSGEEEDFIFTSCTGSNFISGERIEAKISMDYCAINTPGCPVHRINGKIKARVR